MRLCEEHGESAGGTAGVAEVRSATKAETRGKGGQASVVKWGEGGGLELKLMLFILISVGAGRERVAAPRASCEKFGIIQKKGTCCLTLGHLGITLVPLGYSKTLFFFVFLTTHPKRTRARFTRCTQTTPSLFIARYRTVLSPVHTNSPPGPTASAAFRRPSGIKSDTPGTEVGWERVSIV